MMNKHYYLEFKDNEWIAEDHWGQELARHADKEEVRKMAEARGYKRFR
jgi:hypothetical protein